MYKDGLAEFFRPGKIDIPIGRVMYYLFIFFALVREKGFRITAVMCYLLLVIYFYFLFLMRSYDNVFFQYNLLTVKNCLHNLINVFRVIRTNYFITYLKKI